MTSRVVRWLRGLCIALTVVRAGAPASAGAQTLPTEPISVANGTIVLGGEVSATIGPEDPGFFNYSDYEYNALRNVRMGLSVEARPSRRVQVLAELRVDQGRLFEAYGWFLRLRPWPDRRFDIQAGRIPPTFGALSRAAYGSSNILVGEPLAYQYLLSIRPDAIPATADDLLRMRGRGWLTNFPVGDRTAGPGLPIVGNTRWDTGVQAHGVIRALEWTGALTVGSLSDPRVRENNTGRQLAGRLVARPGPALVLGVSAARGAWLDRNLDAALSPGASTAGARQWALGGDAEYSAGPFLIRSEVIRSSWTLPAVDAPLITAPLTATSGLVEGRYKVIPGLYLAARGERLAFSAITGRAGTAAWEAGLWRIEAGGGWSVTRNVIVKAAWQRNHRDGGRVRRETLVTARVVYWF